MKNCLFKNLSIRNCCGIASLDIAFDDKITEITGPTGCGKSTIMKSIYWIFGLNVPNFEPQVNGHQIKEIKTSVTLKLEIDNELFVLERLMEQEWKANKETGVMEFAGNVYSYKINNEEFKENKYKSTIYEILGIDKTTLELLLNIKAFNKLKWEDRRNLIFEMCNEYESCKSLYEDERYSFIKNEFVIGGKNELALAKTLKSEIKKVSDEIKFNKNTSEWLLNWLNEIDSKTINGDIESLFESKLADLKAKNRVLANENAEKIRDVAIIKEFTQKKNEIILPIASNIFKGLVFNLWNVNTAKAEDKYDNCCETVLAKTNSIYDSASCGEKIYINFLVAQGLRKLYQINFPIIIDDRNSITLDLDTTSQKTELITIKEKNFDCTRIDEKFKDGEVI